MAESEITLENLRQLLHIQSELREQAELRGRKAQRALVELLEALAPEEVDQRLKTGRPVDGLAVDELQQLIRQAVGPRLSQAQVLLKESQSLKLQQELKEQVASLQRDLRESRSEKSRLADKIVLLESEKSGVLNQLAALKAVRRPEQAEELRREERPHESGPIDKNGSAPEPDWMEKWRKSETFERDAGILRMIGETGLARRPLIDARSAEILGVKKAGGSIQALMARLVGLKLIEIFRPWKADGSGTGGRYPDLVRLTEQGELAFWLLTGEKPRGNEYDLLIGRHMSPEHTLLNLQAADILREAGYEVNLFPPEIPLSDKAVFMPDLALTTKDGEILFVEVESDSDKNIEKRQSKWRNFNQASGGHLYVVCENRSSMRNIRSEINYCMGNQPFSISLSNLADLQAGKKGQSESIWLEIKHKSS